MAPRARLMMMTGGALLSLFSLRPRAPKRLSFPPRAALARRGGVGRESSLAQRGEVFKRDQRRLGKREGMEVMVSEQEERPRLCAASACVCVRARGICVCGKSKRVAVRSLL